MHPPSSSRFPMFGSLSFEDSVFVCRSLLLLPLYYSYYCANLRYIFSSLKENDRAIKANRFV
ncbi:hypothetical protein TYRP_006433 [Tyrophagus putrescentiae]|nr:hypothetical protein TYRP_006433 [Tyrophagus putrescentiae]